MYSSKNRPTSSSTARYTILQSSKNHMHSKHELKTTIQTKKQEKLKSESIPVLSISLSFSLTFLNVTFLCLAFERKIFHQIVHSVRTHVIIEKKNFGLSLCKIFIPQISLGFAYIF